LEGVVEAASDAEKSVLGLTSLVAAQAKGVGDA